LSEPNRIQYWDSSAIVSLILGDRQATIALRAKERGTHFQAWDWSRIEVHGAFHRRQVSSEYFSALDAFLSSFQYFSLGAEDHPHLLKLLEKHRLRSADTGHLFCLLQTQKLFADIEFVCFDQELVTAAKKEGIRVFS